MSTPQVIITDEPSPVSPGERFKVQWKHEIRFGQGQGFSLPKLDLERLRQLDAEVSRILRPTADQVYAATLNGMFDGDRDGSVNAPTGWFALVRWPNGHSYLIKRDDRECNQIIATDERDMRRNWDSAVLLYGRDELSKVYQMLCDRFAAWADVAEGEM